MNTFWLKMAAFAVVVVILIVLVKFFMPDDLGIQPEKTVYDMAEQDREQLQAEPNYYEDVARVDENQIPEAIMKGGTETARQPGQAEETKQPKPVVRVKLPEPHFRKLSEIEQIEAEQLWSQAEGHFRVGRLPGPGYKITVDACRKIMEKFPGSEYDYKARRALGRIPRRFWNRYKITAEEADLSKFYK